MFKKLLLAAALALTTSGAWAQNPTCPTRPSGDVSNACASTAFVAGASNFTLPNGQIYIGNASNIATARSISGDATVTNTGVWTNRYTAPWTDAVTQTVTQRFQNEVWGSDFGITCDGSTDDLAAFNRAVAHLNANGGELRLPSGTCRVSAALNTITHANSGIRGNGAYSTEIQTTCAACDVFVFSGASFGAVRDLGINVSGTTKNAGAAILTSSWSNFLVTNVRIANHFHGMRFTSSVLVWTDDVMIINPIATNGVGVYIDGSGGNDHYINRTFIQCNPASAGRAGFELKNSNASWFTGNGVLSCVNGMIISPDNGLTVQHLFSTMNAYDSTVGGNCILAQPAVGGTFNRSYFVQDWTATCGVHGVALVGSGTIDDVHFVGHRAFQPQQHGFYFAGSVVNSSVTESSIAGAGAAASNTYDGIHVDANLGQLAFRGNRIGTQGGFSGTMRYGIRFDVGTGDNITVADNDLRGNATGGLSDGTTGTSKQIYGNLPADATNNSTMSQGALQILSTTASTSKTTGALTVAGGLGVAGAVYSNTIVNGASSLLAISPPLQTDSPLAITHGSSASFILHNAGGAADQKYYDFNVTGTTYNQRLLNDAFNSATTYLQVERSGITPTQMTLTTRQLNLASDQTPALSTCGTSPTISGTDVAGTVTMGTGSPTGCTITFGTAYSAVPHCVVTWQANLASMQYTISTSAITLTQTATSSNKVNYHCFGA